MTKNKTGGGTDIDSIVSLVLYSRQAADRPSKALTAEVARAIRPQTEHYAAPHILSRLEPSSESRRAGVFRGAALAAQYGRIPSFSSSSRVGFATEESNTAAATARDSPDGAVEPQEFPADAPGKYRHGGRLGQALNTLARQSDNREAEMRSLGAKVQILPLLGREQAVKIIDGLLARLDNTGIPVDFYNLASTLAYWETSTPEADRALRQRIVFDFFA